MKNSILKIFIATILFVSCSDYLEENPKSIVSPSTILNSVDGFDLALVGAYSHLVGYGKIYGWSNYLIYEAFVDFQESSNRIAVGDIRTRDYPIQRAWRNSYRVINSANLVLASIDNIDGNISKDRIEGEAKFLRGWAYFNLVQFFGGVPLVTEPVENPVEFQPARSAEVDVYTQIVADLKDASNMMDDDAPTHTRANKWVAKGWLAKVYLTMSGNPNNITSFEGESTTQLALNLCKEIISSGRYSVDVPYEDVFLNDNDPDAIWEIRTSPERLGQTMPFIMKNRVMPTQKFIDTFEPTDVRGPLWGIASSYEYNGNIYTFKRPTYLKFIDKETDAAGLTWNSELSFNALRYADVLLMAAEADNEVNNGPSSDAYDWINAVRNRAGISDLSALDYSTFKDAVFNERRHELYGEGFSWFDMKRFDKFNLFNDVDREIKTAIDDHLNYFPIHESILIANPNLTQNPGWE